MSILGIVAIEVRVKTINNLKRKMDILYRKVKQITDQLRCLDFMFMVN